MDMVGICLWFALLFLVEYIVDSYKNFLSIVFVFDYECVRQSFLVLKYFINGGNNHFHIVIIFQAHFC